MFAYQEKKQLQKKENNQPIQRARAANIECPHIGTSTGVGNMIHGVLGRHYLTYGPPGNGNVRAIEQPVPQRHVVDLAVCDPANAVVEFGEIKPDTHAQIRAGSDQITSVLGDIRNTLMPGDQLNVPAWANGIQIPLAQISPDAYTVPPVPNQQMQNVLRVQQHAAYKGLYVYSGI